MKERIYNGIIGAFVAFVLVVFTRIMVPNHPDVTTCQQIVLTDIAAHNKFSAELAQAMGMKQPDFLDTLEGAKK